LATLQGWYRKVYDQPPSQGAAKLFASQALWLVLFVGYLSVQVLIGRHVGPLAGDVLIFAAEIYLRRYLLDVLGLPPVCWARSDGARCFQEGWRPPSALPV
jgi:hypothetical protein